MLGRLGIVLLAIAIKIGFAEAAISPPSNLLTPVTGNKRFVTILCRFADSVTLTPRSSSWFTGLMGSSYPGMANYWREVSYGAVDTVGSIVVGWYNLPRPAQAYLAGPPGSQFADIVGLAQDCTAAADSDVFFPDFFGINVIVNQNTLQLVQGGKISLSLDGETKIYGMTWMQSENGIEQGVMAHEMGHAFGLPHSSGRNTGSGTNSGWDVMSGPGCLSVFRDPTYGCPGQHTISAYKDGLGWIPAERKFVATPGTSRSITLSGLSREPTGSDYLMAQIPIGGSNTHFYTVEARVRAGYDTKLSADAVIIHEVDTTRVFNGGNHVAQAVSDSNGNPRAWQIGQTYRDEANGIIISIVSSTSSGFVVSITTRSDHQTHFAQFANGSGWTSSIILTNPSASTVVTGSVKVFSDQGQMIPISFNSRETAVINTFSIPALGRVVLATNGSGPLISGWALVETNLPVGGVLKFSAPEIGITGVGESSPVRSFVVPVERDAGRGLSSGIAISNPVDRVITANLTLRGLDGREVTGGTASVTLNGKGHIARYIHEHFPAANTQNFQGTVTVTVTNDQNYLVATGLQIGVMAGEFTTVPVIGLEPLPMATDLFFAHLVSGGGWDTTISLINPSIPARTGTVSFFNDSASPLALLVNGNNTVGGSPFSLTGQGGTKMLTSQHGDLNVGWARASSSYVIGGILRFGSSSLGLAAVASSSPTSGFITSVSRRALQGTSTGVAMVGIGYHIAGDNQPITAIMTLRDSSGTIVPGGQASVQLPRNGHVGRFIQEFFPDAETDTFEGTLTVTAVGGYLAATALEIGPIAGQLTTLPVTPLR